MTNAIMSPSGDIIILNKVQHIGPITEITHFNNKSKMYIFDGFQFTIRLEIIKIMNDGEMPKQIIGTINLKK